jgi:hypothetical protein
MRGAALAAGYSVPFAFSARQLLAAVSVRLGKRPVFFSPTTPPPCTWVADALRVGYASAFRRGAGQDHGKEQEYH